MAAENLVGVILTGGRSRRLGIDKATLGFGDRPLACRVADILRQFVSSFWLVTNFPLHHAPLGLPLLLDLYPHRGALGGLLTAMVITGAEYCLLVPCDAPFLQPALLAALTATIRQQRWQVVISQSSRGLEPLPGLYHRSLQPYLQKLVQQGDLRLRQLATRPRTRLLSPAEVRAADPEELSFFNLNTPEDLERGLAHLAAGAAR